MFHCSCSQKCCFCTILFRSNITGQTIYNTLFHQVIPPLLFILTFNLHVYLYILGLIWHWSVLFVKARCTPAVQNTNTNKTLCFNVFWTFNHTTPWPERDKDLGVYEGKMSSPWCIFYSQGLVILKLIQNIEEKNNSVQPINVAISRAICLRVHFHKKWFRTAGYVEGWI